MRIEVPHDRIVDFCRRHHIRRLALFGSVLRDDFTPDSDVDVLVEFEEGKTPGFAYFTMQEELSDILGRRADLKTPNELSKYFRDEVLAEAEAANRVPAQGRARYQNIPWQNTVWKIIKDELPVLIAALERALPGHVS
ncbi:MAG TPA: nucleotidyltransferase domain-containing protein [Patescibacteria group bacterium]|nr:nucleotidyltransferase domain-containing protein [Patescibacteria group bacterium]